MEKDVSKEDINARIAVLRSLWFKHLYFQRTAV